MSRHSVKRSKKYDNWTWQTNPDALKNIIERKHGPVIEENLQSLKKSFAEIERPQPKALMLVLCLLMVPTKREFGLVVGSNE